MSSSPENRRAQILNTYNENPGLSYLDIGRLLGVSRHTVRNVISRFKDSLSIVRKPGSVRPIGFVDRDKAKQIVTSLKRNPGLSLRKLAQKYQCSPGFVFKVKRRYGFYTFVAQKAPYRTPHQHKLAKQRARKLYTRMLVHHKGCTVMDDETYCFADFSQLPEKKYYSGYDSKGVPRIFRVKQLMKFPKKFLIWQAICTCGRKTQPFITTRTMNAQIYLDECLKKRLLPFLKCHKVPTIFWPDLASIHYAGSVLKWMEENSIRYVPKQYNPPCVPELRPIEMYWAQMKKCLKRNLKPSKDIKNFKVK